MTENSPIVRRVDGERSITKMFHRLNSVLPSDQHIISVLPETSAQEALELLAKHGFSQVPVKIGEQVLGLFSYRSFARAMITLGQGRRSPRLAPADVTVDECMEQPPFARVTDEFRAWFDELDLRDALLVGDPNRLQGIVTAMDILRYLYKIASPFVLISEIEQSLRELIREAVDDAQLAECASMCLTSYAEDKRPTKLVDMSFNDYVQIVGDSRTWSLYFEPIFKGDRNRTRAKLDYVRGLRNELFHFKKEITVEEYDTLSANRDWMLQKATAAEARARGA